MVALVLATVMLRQPARAPAREARRLMDMVGWAAVLPQMLAALGAGWRQTMDASKQIGRTVREIRRQASEVTRSFTRLPSRSSLKPASIVSARLSACVFSCGGHSASPITAVITADSVTYTRTETICATS